MKKCPYCAEEIKDEAVVCRFCGRNVDAKSMKAAVGVQTRSSSIRGISIIFLIIAGLVFTMGFGMDALNVISGNGLSLSQTMLSFLCVIPSLVLAFVFFMMSK
jgi:hypothetical protein